VVSIERLKNRIIAPNITNNTSSSDKEYMNINDKNSVSDYKRLLCISDNILEINKAQNIPQAVFTENIENGRKEEIDNGQDMEALDLSDNENDEIVFQNEVDQENNTLQSSDDNDEDINDQNHFETEEQKLTMLQKI